MIEYRPDGLIYHQPDGKERTIYWETLRAVLIETGDQGPFSEDLWWILIDAEGPCTIPQIVGSDALLAQLQALPDFDNEAVIEAMGSVENKLFVCWQRQPA